VTTRNVRQQDAHRRSRPGEPSAAPARTRDEAITALVTLGWKRGVATTAVDEAMGHVAQGERLDILIREALRRCPRPLAA
jgi:Holliday junction resolvasome RuvABC DNA-binding subunit